MSSMVETQLLDSNLFKEQIEEQNQQAEKQFSEEEKQQQAQNPEQQDQEVDERRNSKIQKQQDEEQNNQNEEQQQNGVEKNIEQKEKNDDDAQEIKKVVQDQKTIIKEEQDNKQEQIKYPPPNEIMLPEKRIQIATQIKEEALPLIKSKDFLSAMVVYEKALQYIHPDFFRQCPKELVENLVKITHVLLGNLSFCHYNLQNYQVAIQFADEVLKNDPSNVKLIYRKAVAYKQLGDYERAQQFIKQARVINLQKGYDNTDIHKEYQEIVNLYRTYLKESKDKEKEMYQKMMQPKQFNENQKVPTAQQQQQKTENQQQQVQQERIQTEVLSKKQQKKMLIKYLLSGCIGVGIPLTLQHEILSVKGFIGSFALGASAYGFVSTHTKNQKILFLALGVIITSILQFSRKTKALTQ